MKSYFSSIAFIITILCTSCLPENEAAFEPQTEADIIKYIEDNDLNAQKSDSGLYYVIDVEGTGTQPTSTSTVTVSYTGSFLNKSIFEQSSTAGVSFNLQNVIPGWTEGITYFKEGGEGILIIPSQLAYGNNTRGTIPAGAVLVFKIKLISVD